MFYSVRIASLLILFGLTCACSPKTRSPSNLHAPEASPIRTSHRDYGTWQSSMFGGGGYLQNIVPAPSNPTILYCYVDVGGAYRSEDAGLTWRMLHGGLPPGDGYYSVRGLDVHPDNPDWVLIAVGNQWSTRKGVFLSQDGGQTWSLVLDAQVYGNEAFRSTGFIFARDGKGRLHFASAGDGIWVSEDHGLTWSLRGLEGNNINDITFADDGRGWACAHPWTPHRTSALEGGFFFSRDHGENWTVLEGPAPDELVFAPDGALVGIFAASRLLRSEDDGVTWHEYAEGLPINPEAAKGYTSESRFRALTTGPDFLLLGSSRGTIYRRGTGEEAWRKIERESVTEIVEGEPWWGRLQPGVWPHFGAAMGSLTVMPGQPDHWWFTDWYSAYETRDAGKNWVQRIDGIEVTVIHHILANPADPARIHVGMADNAYAQSTDGGVRYDTPKKTFSNVKMLAVSPALPGRLYGVGDARAEWRAEKLWVSTDSGATWWAAPMQGLPPRENHSMNSIAVHAQNPYEVVLGLSGKVADGGGVYRSLDGGRSFEPVNDGLEEEENLFRHEIWSIGPELAMSQSGQLVLASHDTGRIHYHDGQRWHRSQFQPGGAPRYLTSAGEDFFIASREGGLLKSTDGGRTWNAILDGEVLVVAADAQQPGLIAAATAQALKISRDGGKTWSEHPLPPQGQVRTLSFGGSRLHAGTAGGGIFWMAHNPSGLASLQAGEIGPGLLPVRETLEARLPDLADPSFTAEATVDQHWTRWSGQGNSEKSWSEASADPTGGSLVLRSLEGPVNSSVGYLFPAVDNSFKLALAWKADGSETTEVQIALRSYREKEQIHWQTLHRSTGSAPDWTWIEREVRLAEGADQGEVVVVLTGEGSVWIDALSASIPPQIFGNPRK